MTLSRIVVSEPVVKLAIKQTEHQTEDRAVNGAEEDRADRQRQTVKGDGQRPDAQTADGKGQQHDQRREQCREYRFEVLRLCVLFVCICHEKNLLLSPCIPRR